MLLYRLNFHLVETYLTTAMSAVNFKNGFGLNVNQ